MNKHDLFNELEEFARSERKEAQGEVKEAKEAKEAQGEEKAKGRILTDEEIEKAKQEMYEKNLKKENDKNKKYDKSGITDIAGLKATVVKNNFSKLNVINWTEKFGLDNNNNEVRKNVYTTTANKNKFLVEIKSICTTNEEVGKKELKDLTVDEENEVTVTCLVVDVINSNRITKGEELILTLEEFKLRFRLALDDYCNCCGAPMKQNAIDYMTRIAEMPTIEEFGMKEKHEWAKQVINRYERKLCLKCQKKGFASGTFLPHNPEDGELHVSINAITSGIEAVLSMLKENEKSTELYCCNMCNEKIDKDIFTIAETLLDGVREADDKDVLCPSCAKKKYKIGKAQLVDKSYQEILDSIPDLQKQIEDKAKKLKKLEKSLNK